MKKYLTISLILLCFTCNNHKSEYLIQGHIENVPVNFEKIYLKTESFIDSSKILNGKFKFVGNINNTTRAKFFLKENNSTKDFWLENTKISLFSKDVNLEKSKITGGKTQKDLLNFEDRKINIERKTDDLIKYLEKEKLNNKEKDSIFNLYEIISNKRDAIDENFILENPNSFQSIYLLNINKVKWQKGKVKRLFSNLGNNLKQSQYGNLVSRYLDLNLNPKVGEKYIDFIQFDSNGKEIKFSNILGKYTLVEFWASWCKPCVNSNIILSQLYNQYNNVGLNIVSISLDTDKSDWLNAIKRDSLIWHNLSDLKGIENEPSIIYNIKIIPDNFLLDSRGIIIDRNIKPEDLKLKFELLFK